MTNVPRRLPPTQGQRIRNVTITHASLSGQGRTTAARPVQQSRPATQIYRPSSSGAPSVDRLSLFVRIDPGALTGSNVYIPAWDATLGPFGGVIEAVGTSVSLNTPDDGGIYFLTAGVYAVDLSMRVIGTPHLASPDCSIRFCMETTTKSFDCGFRGGDGASGREPFPSTSSTYYAPGTGDGIYAVLSYQNLDLANITQIFCEVDVQRIT